MSGARARTLRTTTSTYTIPLCKNGPGNVGWLDWHPPHGGTSELIDAIGPPGTLDYQFTVPGWYSVPATGNVNSSGVEDALNYYAMNQEPVLIPMFDATCNTQPTGPGVLDCPPPNVGGNGNEPVVSPRPLRGLPVRRPQGSVRRGQQQAGMRHGQWSDGLPEGHVRPLHWTRCHRWPRARNGRGLLGGGDPAHQVASVPAAIRADGATEVDRPRCGRATFSRMPARSPARLG